MVAFSILLCIAPSENFPARLSSPPSAGLSTSFVLPLSWHGAPSLRTEQWRTNISNVYSFLPSFLPFFLIFDNFPGYPSYSNLWKLSKHASFKVFKVISVAFARKNIQYKGTIFTFFYIAIYQSNVYIVSSCTYVMTSSCIPPSPDPSSRPVFR